MVAPGRIYKWDKGSSFKVSAQVAGEYLDELREKHGGVLAPREVVEAAKDKGSPLHGEFTWEVEKAAQKHWEARARNILNHLVVVKLKVQSAIDSPPAMINLRVNTPETGVKRGYVSIADVYKNESWRQLAIAECLRMLDGLKKRFGHLQELASIWEAIDKAEKNRAKKST